MKIISCHIENFGKWRDKTFTFSSGCNLICEENGWGKSMLAAFIRVMFYGFEYESKRDDFANERRRYRPWQGGVYGGQLTFETGGKVYQVSRIFGDREKNDRFELRDGETNLKSSDYSSQLGRELFHIDSASFTRTVFITQNDCETFTTDGINAKIGNLTGEMADISQYEQACDKLTDMLNKMNPGKKNGSLSKLKTEIGELEYRVSFGPVTDREIGEALRMKNVREEERRLLRQTRASLEERQRIVSKYKDLQAKKRQYESLCDEYQERRGQAALARKYFPARLPEEEELNQLVTDSKKLYAEERDVQRYRLTGEEIGRLERGTAQFSVGIPSDEDLARQREKITELQNLRVKMAETSLTEGEEEKLLLYEDLFADGSPEQEEIARCQASWSRRAQLRSTLNSRKASLGMMGNMAEAAKQEAKRKARWEAEQRARQEAEERAKLRIRLNRQRRGAVILLIPGLLAAVGGGFLLSVNPIIGAVVMGAGVVLAAAEALKLIKLNHDNIQSDSLSSPPEERTDEQEEESRILTLEENIRNLEKEIRQDESSIFRTEEETKEYFAAWKLEYREETVPAQLERLSRQAEEYTRLLSKRNKGKELKLGERIADIEGELRAFLETYSVDADQDNDGNLIRLERDRNEYVRLSRQNRNYRDARKTWQDHKERVTEYVTSLSLEPQADLPEQLQEIQNRFLTYIRCVRELERAGARKEEFEAAEDVSRLAQAVIPEETESLEELNRKIREMDCQLENLQEAILQEERNLDQLREKRDAISADEEQLRQRREEYEQAKKKYDLLSGAREMLGKARTSFTARYTGPVTTAFRRYYGMLTGDAGTDYRFDANTHLTVSEQGMQRETRFFSAGYRDLMGICMRMALIEAMYQDEKPMVIFDDPFVNLDSEKTEAALKLMEAIGREYQVIYFTCHDSRLPR